MLSRTRTTSLGALLALALALPAAAQSPLCTPYAPPWASNNGGTAGGVVFYDLNVINAVRITGFDCNLSAAANTSVTLELYTTPTTYVGQNTNAAAWTLVGTAGPVLSSARESATSFTLASPVVLTPGSYGIGYRVIGSGQAYTGTGTGAQLTTSNADLSLTSGAACSALFSGSFFSFRNWNGCIHYTLAVGLFANFSATPTSGATPLNVTFTDTSYTSDPGGVTSWAWDLDGDAIVDSNSASPSFTYNTCGRYNVTLTVTDAQNPSSSLTKNGYIFADPQLQVTANFAAAPNAGAVPLTVNFSDTSTGSPTSWAWDFDGDTIVDSNAQNPSFTYSTPGFYSVTLTAANACFSDGETKANFINVVGATQNTVSADKLEYQFNEVRGSTVANVASTTLFPATGSFVNSAWQRDPNRALFKGNEAGFGCMSYSASNANWVNTGSTFRHTGSLTVMWWARRDPASTVASPFGYFFGDGGFRCFMGSAGILFGGGTGTTLSATYTANWQGHLQPGVWHHYAVVVDDATGFNTIYQDGVPHAGRSYAAGTYTYTGTTGFAVGAISAAAGGSRASLHYDMDDFRMYGRALTQAEIQTALVHENPTGALMENGCTDSNSFTPRLTAVGAPQIGNLLFGLQASGLEPGRPTAVYVGISGSLGGLLPFDLSGTGIFAPGCRLLVSPDIILNFGSGGGSVFLPAPVPLDPTLQGGHTYNQLISLGSGPLSAVSNAIDTQMQF